jgi:diaminohydroxyphosphoribosylaminopyrimidine deaminase/5-amino-6-(5-phosphoribosylamino)uracil reductase
MTMSNDAKYMRRALELAAKALLVADPNPAVGCVIVRDGAVVGEGWTAPPGGPHAEIAALAAAGARAAGACVYVTLEPCCHTGRTGPCTTALIAAGVARVVYAAEDPNPAVAGGGIRLLRDAGIEVEAGEGARETRQLNAGFFSRMQRGRPFVRLKIAASIDGRTALGNGVSQWITGAQARADVHYWRARSSAVLSGAATVLADDSLLTARPGNAPGPFVQPLRVVLDPQLRIPPTARMLEADSPVLILTCAPEPRLPGLPQHVELAAVAADSAGRCDLPAVLALLGARAINDLWVEAGSTLAGAFLSAGVIDELFVYTAPVVLGDDGLGMFALRGLTSMAQRYEFEVNSVEALGSDLRVVYRPATVARGGHGP